MDWRKFLSREFLVAIALMIVATVALFVERMDASQWTIACGAFIGTYTAAKTVQKLKRPPQ